MNDYPPALRKTTGPYYMEPFDKQFSFVNDIVTHDRFPPI